MKTLMKAKTQTLVATGEIVRDRRGWRYYVSHIHNNKIAVVSMDERKIHMTAPPEQFGCYLTGDA
jgi:hypothetical protein